MDKSAFRAYCLKKLRRAEKKSGYLRHKKVVAKVENIIKKYNPKSILLYLPMGHEPDISPLLRRLRGRMKIYVPFMEGESFKLVKYRLPLRVKRYGIKEPNHSHFHLSKIDMAVVPVLGVDGRCRRIGFGKGMYDRFFGSLGYRPTILFVQIAQCYTDTTVTDDYDVTADIYITPETTLYVGKRYGNRTDSRRCRRRR